MKYLAEMTYVEVQEMGEGALLIIPVGAIEAHGPHLPLQADVTIARAMAAAGAALLEERGLSPVVIGPAVQFTAAGFASGFAGTLSLKPETVTALLADALRSFHRSGFSRIALANSHLDPAHTACLHEAVRIASETPGLTVIFPDITRKPWALRLTEEFKSGACHAGRFETSLVMAARPETVREAIRATLAPNPASLSQAIKEGRTSFEEAGGPDAYFGFPADASVDEGRETLSVLAAILADAVTGDGAVAKKP
jgi:creatinine amidohydrolase